jgi:hypothetical protein
MNRFTLLDQWDGEQIAIPTGSIVFVEESVPEARKKYPGATSGVFYHDGGEAPVAIMLKVPYARLLKLAKLGRPSGWIEVARPDKTKAATLGELVSSYRGLADAVEKPEGARTLLKHRLGTETYSLFALQTFAEIHAMMEASAPPMPSALGAQEEPDADEHNDRIQPGRSRGGARSAPKVRAGGSAKGPGRKG